MPAESPAPVSPPGSMSTGFVETPTPLTYSGSGSPDGVTSAVCSRLTLLFWATSCQVPSQQTTRCRIPCPPRIGVRPVPGVDTPPGRGLSPLTRPALVDGGAEPAGQGGDQIPLIVPGPGHVAVRPQQHGGD